MTPLFYKSTDGVPLPAQSTQRADAAFFFSSAAPCRAVPAACHTCRPSRAKVTRDREGVDLGGARTGLRFATGSSRFCMTCKDGQYTV